MRVTGREHQAGCGAALADYVQPSLAPKTIVTYREVVRVHLVPALGALDLVALRPTHIQSLYSRMLVSGRRDGRGGLSARSVARYHQILHAALRQAVRWQLLVHNPADAVEPPRAARREIPTVTPAQAWAVMAAAAETSIGPFVRLALLTGMRRGELLALRWADVDLEGGALHVQQTAQRIVGEGIVFRQPKMRLSRRSIALSPDAVAVLRQHRRRQAEARLLAGSAYAIATSSLRPGSGRRWSPATSGARGWGLLGQRAFPAFASTTFGTPTRR